MNRSYYVLSHQNARKNALHAVAIAPDGYVVEVKPKTRSLDQNAKFHAICGDVAKQCEYMGKRWPLEAWKVLFISGHAIATKHGAEVVPGLENEFVNIRESSASMSKSRLSSLIEYCVAWCAQNEVFLDDECFSETPRRKG